MFYTKEQVQRLEKYRKSFETAVRSGFARNVGSVALKEIEQVYDEALGSHYSYNSGCSICVLGFLKRVGEPFLKEAEIYRKKEEKEKQKAEKTNTEVVESVEVKEENLVFETINTCNSAATNTCNSAATKTNKRTRKKKVEENGTE